MIDSLPGRHPLPVYPLDAQPGARAGGERWMSALTRLARLALRALAVLCAVTLGAGVSVARMLPARLALFQLPRLKAAAPARPGLPPPAATGIPAARAGPPAPAPGPDRPL